MINEFDRVRIISTGETGIVVDIRNTTKKFFLLEMDFDNRLVDCTESEIEKLMESESGYGKPNPQIRRRERDKS